MAEFAFEEEEFHSSLNGRTVLRIFRHVLPHWPMMAGFIIAVAMMSTIESTMTYLSKLIIDVGIIPQDGEALLQVIILFGVLTVFQALCVFAFIYLTGVLGERVEYEMRKMLFEHLQKLSLSYFSKTPVGWIMSRVTSDTERIAELISWGMLDVVWACMIIITSLIFMLTINWQLALLVFAVIPILMAIANGFQRRIILEYRNTRRANSRITAQFNENITGVRVVKALGREEANLREFGTLTNEYYRSSFRAAWLSALFLPSVQIVSALALGVIVYYGGLQTEIGGMTIGGIQAFIGYVTFMLWPVQDLARVFASMQHAIASAERVFSLLDAQPEVVDRPGAVDPGTVRGKIVFENVDFYYDADKPVLKNFNLEVQPGEMIALVGPTGAGKSTIVNLICRFYEPRSGRITIDGRDYRDISLHALQSRIGIVLQTPHLFSGTIRENLRYGRLDATDEEIEAAARLVGAHDFIITLDKGYDEEVGEGGNLLSVGQKQLISLARAVLANPEIFIMDEATSSVDTLTEALIQRGMDVLMAGRTSFVIAHRLSTIRRADRILVIANGGISEMGSHADLLRQRGHYYRLYTQQFRRERELEAGFDLTPEMRTPG
ncbi:MAG: ABC transporter ATP-binding protein [Candidatus Flexifilum sp.]|jgi:ATP-binding cassette subfamily B protein